MDNGESLNLSVLDRARIAQDNVTVDGTQRNDKTERSRSSGVVQGSGFRQRFAPMLNLVTHILILVFTFYIVILASREDTLFTWHPPLLTVGFMMLMAEAILTLSPSNYLTRRLSRGNRIIVHWVLQALATVSIYAGFLVIVINKNMNNKSHFYTTHGIVGLIAVIGCGITSLDGVITLFSMNFKDWVSPVKTKLIHIVIGMITFILGMIALALGLYTHWFMRNSNETLQVVFTVIVAMATFLTLENAVRSAYKKAEIIARRL